MRRIYEHPAIVEALCEFRFAPSQPWDWTVPGLFYREVESEFPIRRQFNPFEIGIEARVNAEQNAPLVQNILTNVERMQFVRKDERALMQVGPDLVSVNHLKPYSNWEMFKGMINRALDVYRQVANPRAISRIGLRYINRLEFPEQQSVNIENFLRAMPTVPEDIPQVFMSWAQRAEIPFEQKNGLLVLQSSSVREQGQKNVAFLLDLDFITLQAEAVSLDSAMEWVQIAHDEVEKTFEACITDEARQLLGEVKHGE